MRYISEPFGRAAIGLALSGVLLGTARSEVLRDIERVGIKAVLERETESALQDLDIAPRQ